MIIIKIEYIFAIFALIGALDKLTGDHFKLGKEFEKGIMTIGPLVISMAGMIVLAPVIAKTITFLLSDIIKALGMDMSVMSTFLPSDSGGAVTAYALSDNIALRGYNGIVVASMFGATICPVIPMALQMIDKKYHEDVLNGFLCGLATIPIGCVVAGFMLKIPFLQILLNTAPSFILSLIICVLLVKKPIFVRKALKFVGNLLFAVMTIGLAVGIFQKLTSYALIPNIAPLDESFLVIGNIAIILAGVFPMLAIVSKIFGKLFSKAGKLMHINDTSVLGIITTLANVIPVFALIENMDKKGRIFNMAFAVSAGFVLGDHLAFALSFDSAFALPMVLGKLISGITAVLLAQLLFKKQTQ